MKNNSTKFFLSGVLVSAFILATSVAWGAPTGAQALVQAQAIASARMTQPQSDRTQRAALSQIMGMTSGASMTPLVSFINHSHPITAALSPGNTSSAQAGATPAVKQAAETLVEARDGSFVFGAASMETSGGG